MIPPRLLRVEGRWLAAVLALGPGAVLSHRSAAALWDLIPATGRKPEVTVAGRPHQRAGIHIHYTRSLPADDVTDCHGIPCTTVARTAVDLAAVAVIRTVEKALGQAEILKLYDRPELERATRNHRPGSANLRRLLERDDAHRTLTKSVLEDDFLELCDGAGLERPELNVPFVLPDGTPISIDAYFRASNVAVELDSRTYHATRRAFADDRRRDAQLTLAGLRPLRFTKADLTAETAELLRALSARTTRRRARVPGRAPRAA